MRQMKGPSVEELEAKERQYPKMDLWLVWTVNPVTGEHMLRAVCTDEGLADFYRKALEYHIKDAREGGHGGGEIGSRLVSVEKTDSNHLYAEETMMTIRDIIKNDRGRAI